MNKNTGNISIVLLIILLMTGTVFSEVSNKQGQIKRLTHTGNDRALYPCLSDDGERVLYVLEMDSETGTNKSLKLMNIETTRG